MTKSYLRSFFSGIAIAALSACGGGGDAGPAGSSPATSAQGFYNGTTNTGRGVTGVVLSDGTYYVLYSGVGNPNSIAGVVQGTGTMTSGSLSSTNTRDFNLEGLGVLSATLSASYTTKSLINGSVAYTSGSTTTFTGTYDANYEVKPLLSTVAGTYTGQVALSIGVQAATVTVSSTGTISGGGSGCSISGIASPRSDGNVYDVSLTFGPSPCYFTNQTFRGMGYFNSATKRLYAAAPNAGRTDGVLFVGTKP